MVAGVAGGALADRLRVPHVAGQILAGLLIGHAGLDLFSAETVDGLAVVTEFALGVIAVSIGDHLNIRRMRNAGRRVFLLLLTEATLTPLVVFGVVYAVRGELWLSTLFAAMAISTAPATVIALIKQRRARGVFVKTLSAAVALNNITCVALFEVARLLAGAALAPELTTSLGEVLGQLARQLGGATLVGACGGLLLILVTRHEVRTDRLVAATFVTVIIVAGVALQLGLSVLLSCLALGFTLANGTPGKEELGGAAFENVEVAVLAAFFTLAGMHLEFSLVIPAGVTALALVGGRVVAKLASAGAAMQLAGATRAVRRLLGVALVPQAGVAVGLILLVQRDPALASIAEVFLAVGLTTVMINEIGGSFLTDLALRRSGEAGRARPRLIDFLHEENITSELQAATKEEAIAQLVDLLIDSHHLKVDRDSLLQTVLEREAQASTCLGAGLAVPHGTLDDVPNMLGAMGINREGLAFETPDDTPVHCIILLVTPTAERDRHLEVLASLARAIGQDEAVREALYHARSPAHAYEALNAERADTFNYYLGDV